MKFALFVVFLSTLLISGCAARKERLKLLAECRYMLVKYPGVKSLHAPECYILAPGTVVKAENFVASYDFERFIKSIYPPNLTLVVTRKGSARPTPILIKTGKAGERVFKPLNHTVDHTGNVHRYEFGRYASRAIEGIGGKTWDYKIILTVESQK